MGCRGHAPLSPINPGKSRGFNKGRFMERQNPAAPWNNRVGSRGSLPGKPRRSPLRSFPRYSRPKIMEMAPAVPSATEFQALKTTKGSDSQRKRLSQIFILVFGPLVSPAVFSHIPGVQEGREADPSRSKDSRLRGQGWGGTRDIPRSQENREILRLPELIPSPDSVGNRDLGGGSGIEGGHGPGSAPSAALGDGVFLGIPTSGKSNLIRNSLWKCSLPKSH